MSQSVLREIPSVTSVLEEPRVEKLIAGRQRPWITRVVRQVIADLRQELQRHKHPAALTKDALLKLVVDRVLVFREMLLGPTLRRVTNGTGVIVHTNLGRSLYPDLAVEWMEQAARFNVDLEFDLEAGTRGHRGRKVEAKIALLTGAEDALLINNNAAAIWLAVRCVAGKGRVVLSRGETVAIGGSFRMHEILAETGCELVEVGTTNRTSLDDYRQALTPGAVLLKVHRSNFDVVGFTEEVALPELAELSREGGHPLLYDAGSGALFPYTELGLPYEPTLSEDLAAGPDLVTCSGDKLLGGGQAGFVLGRADLIAALRRHPMRRAFRVDKTTMAAADAVLTLYLGAEDVPPLPTLIQVALPVAELQRRAEQLLAELASAAPADWSGSVVAGESSVGGGSFSNASLPTVLLLWQGPKSVLETNHARLRQGDPALVTRMNQDGLSVDLRSVIEEEIPLIAAAFRRIWGTGTDAEQAHD
ncbi:MAG: L-seryl-tRNA(Sec) selenium transferase [bacterium]